MTPDAPQEIETGTDEVVCHLASGVASVTLNRPDARNALTFGMKEALVGLLPRLAEDGAVRAVLLTGAGAAFCAGGDTKRMAREGTPPSPEERKRQLRWEHGIPLALHRMGKPTVAALGGPAAGAGFSLALACDLRIMAESAFVTTAYVRLGLSGDYGASWFLTRLVGPARAREILFLGERLTAAECGALGLANRVVPDDAFAEAARTLAERLASGPPIALGYMKDNLNRALDDDLEAVLALEAERMVDSATTDDYVEAVRAFAERRPPIFKGKERGD